MANYSFTFKTYYSKHDPEDPFNEDSILDAAIGCANVVVIASSESDAEEAVLQLRESEHRRVKGLPLRMELISVVPVDKKARYDG